MSIRLSGRQPVIYRTDSDRQGDRPAQILIHTLEISEQKIMKSKSTGGLVYSTELGRVCSECRLALAACTCKATAKAAIVGDGAVRVSRQTKGRGGKSVTLITGLALDPLALGMLAKQLRTASGAGGTVKEGVIELQGDHRALVLDALEQRGHRAKLVGG